MPSKYHAVRTTIDGIMFDSKREAARYVDLRLLEKAGHIRGLKTQVRYDFNVHGIVIGFYKADFVYESRHGDDFGREIVEDVKGMRTPVYRLKARLMQACHGITIRETK